jgi:ligand-binding sensor domain-containing protein
MRIKKCIFLIALLAVVLTGLSQVIGTKHIALQDDNKAFKINALLKSRDGYIYAGTTAGFYKFDGFNFKKISFSNAPVKDTITALFEDDNGDIWLGFINGHLAKKTNGQFQYIDPEEGTPKKAITCFLQDKLHQIWFGTNGEGIYYFKNNHLYLIDEEEGLSDKHIHALALTNEGDVLAATDQGINCCTFLNNKKNIEIIGPKNGLPDYYVTTLAPAGDNDFWVGLQQNGVCLYNHNTKQVTHTVPASKWVYGQVNAAYATKNNLWIATNENGLIKQSLADQSFSFEQVTENKNSITKLIQDDEGNMWMNTSAELIGINGDRLSLLPLYDKHVYETIHTILSDRQNNIWAGTDGGLIKYSNIYGSPASKFYPLAGFTARTDLTSLYQDVFDNIWIGSMGLGIYVLNPSSGKYRNINENLLLKNTSILSITGSGNTICAGGLEGTAVLFELTEKNKNISSVYNFTNYNNIPNIGNNYIYCVFKDSRGRVWFGTDGKGLTVMENDKFKLYTAKDGLKDDHILSFTEDRKGNIWFSTEYEGIYCFDGQHFKNYTHSNGISSLKISSIKTDIAGNIVIACENGLDVLNPVTGTVSYLNSIQGIDGASTDVGNCTQDTGGNILLATPAGIIVYKPGKNLSARPKTVIDNVQLFLKDINKASPGRFAYDENSFTFNFTGLYYTNPQEVKYQYKLEGRDTSWISTRDRSISFPRLQPGKYVFHIRSSLNDNFENANEASYQFNISTPFWKQWWFIALCIAAFASLLYWYMKRRENNIKKMQQLQQEKIQFQFQVLRNQVNPHFLFNSFNTLISTIEENPKMAVEYVEQLADFFRNIVNQRDKDVITLSEEITLLQTYFFLQQKRYGDHLKLDIHISDIDQRTTYIPPLTLQLLMENAIKHNSVSKESLLTVSLFCEKGSLVIKNNINRKFVPEAGTGMGLQNIINRYRLLSDIPVVVVNDGTFFSVTLPLLKS